MIKLIYFEELSVPQTTMDRLKLSISIPENSLQLILKITSTSDWDQDIAKK